MKKKLLLVLVLVTVFSSGCNKVTEDNSLEKGQEKLESYKYDEAMALFSQALDNDPENAVARSMYMQARKMQNAQIYEDNYEYEKAIKELDSIVNINDGSKKIKRESVNKKSELEKLQQAEEKEALERKQNAKQSSQNAMNKLESEIIYNNKKKEEEEKKKQEAEEEKKKQESTQVEEIPNVQNPSIEKPKEENVETTTDIQVQSETDL